MGIIWRFVVLLIGGWFLAGVILGDKMPRPLPFTLYIASVVAAFLLAWAWRTWSINRKARQQP